MKAFKIGIGVIVALIILGVGAAFYLSGNIDSIVKRLIETKGTEITQTEVFVGGVSIQLSEGRGTLINLQVANPARFDTATALDAGEIVLDIAPTSVAGDVIVINEVVVEDVNLTAEQQGLTTNLQALLKSIQQASSGGESTDGEGDVRLMVEKLRFADSRLKVVTEAQEVYVIDMPSINLENLGNREQGLTPAELGKAVLQPVIRQALEAAQDRLKELAQDKVEGELKNKAKEKLGEDAEQKIRDLRGLVE